MALTSSLTDPDVVFRAARRHVNIVEGETDQDTLAVYDLPCIDVAIVSASVTEQDINTGIVA